MLTKGVLKMPRTLQCVFSPTLVFLYGMLAFLIQPMMPGASFASPFDTYGFGGRGMAMGGAVSSIVEDYTATYYNPAGFAFTEKAEIGGGFIYGETNLCLNGEKQDVPLIRAFQAGATFPISRGKFRFFKLGVGANIPTSPLYLPVSQDAKEPHFVLYNNHYQRAEINVCGAFKILPNLSIGGGATILANLDFPEKLQWFNTAETFLVAEVPTNVSFFPLVGLKYKPTDSLSLAAVYRGAAAADLTIAVKFTSSGVQLIPDVATLLTNFYKPHEVLLGASYTFRDKWIVGLDVAWMDYSKMKTPMPIYEFDVPEVIRVILSMINAPPPDFHDIFVPRIGVEYLINKHVSVRSGYVYRPSPAPDQTGINNYADSDKHVITVGTGVNFFDPWKLRKQPIIIDLVFQAHILEERSVIKTDPEDPVGDYTIDGEIFLGGIFLKHIF
jgi:long-chain fatty acid transport protein